MIETLTLHVLQSGASHAEVATQVATKVLVGEGALAAAEGPVGDWLEGRTVFVLTTPRVRTLHGERLQGLLAKAKRAVFLEVAEGEEAKTVEVAADLWSRMLEAGGKRDSRLLSFGGGSVSDLGGFVAGCFLRGIEVAHVPTTLLAQVDAALGGKCGVDLPGGKNTVGVFLHPRWVVSDAAVLATLPRDEIRAALAEVVKVALMLDPRLLERVEEDLDALLAGDAEALGPVVLSAARAKLVVVERDPREVDERRLLNFGHTLAHALEACLGYQGLRHGDAVAYGVLFALRLACSAGPSPGLPPEVAERMRRLLARFGLPDLPDVPREDLMAAMERDKKAREAGLVWVLPANLGQGRMVAGIPRQTVLRELEAFAADPWRPFT